MKPWPTSQKSRVFATALLLLGAMFLAAKWNWFPSPREPGYRFALAWGNSGSGPGQFHQPIGIVVAGEEVLVSDTGNNRIQVFDREGNFLREFGAAGDAPGQLSRPMHMDFVGGRLYVAEYLNDRIQTFTAAGKFLSVVLAGSGSQAGQFDAPGGVAVSDEGRLYVADFNNQRLQALDAQGNFLWQVGTTGKKGIAAGMFNYPTDVALMPSGNVVVADAYNDRIQVFSPRGTFLRKWGGPLATNIAGSAPGWFRTATGVAVGPLGNVFVADFYNHRVQKFTAQGVFLVALGEHGSGQGQFERPTDMAVDADGNVYVVDFGNDRIQKFSPLAPGSRD